MVSLIMKEMAKTVAVAIALSLTVACSAQAEDSVTVEDDIADAFTYAVGLSIAVTHEIYSPAPSSYADGCIAGKKEDCVSVLVMTALVAEANLAMEMNMKAKELGGKQKGTEVVAAK